jgi:DUF4097 and DUF4098 domain-containing protein YvlB
MKLHHTKLAFFILLFFILNPKTVLSQNILAEANFSIENARYLEVEGSFCNIELNGYSGSSLKMDGKIEGSGDPDKYEIIYREDGNKIKVWIERPNNIWRNIEGLLHFDVPENVTVIVDNSSGNIEAEDLYADEITLEASSGNITGRNLKGVLRLKCSSGNITLSEQNGNASLRASSGNLKVDEVNGDLEAHASSGNITIYEVLGDVEADCSSGNIKLRDIEGKLDVGTSSGNIRGEDVLLTGDSRFKASSGNVTIGLLNSEDDLSFDLDSGSGNLYAAGSTSDDRLILRKGPINITGITTSGSQRYTTD